MNTEIDIWHGTSAEVAEYIQGKHQPLYGYARTINPRYSPILTNNPGYALQWAGRESRKRGGDLALLKYRAPRACLIDYGTQPSLFHNRCFGTNLTVDPMELSEEYLRTINISRELALKLTTPDSPWISYLGVATFYQVPYDWLQETENIELESTRLITLL